MTYFYVWVIIGKALDIELEDLGLMEKSAYAFTPLASCMTLTLTFLTPL